MSRRATATAAPPEATAQPLLPPVHEILPSGVYFPEHFQTMFRVRATTLRREVREGRLRIAKRGGRYILLGSWILEWIEAGEIRRREGGAR
jgi:hypothetical protein